MKRIFSFIVFLFLVTSFIFSQQKVTFESVYSFENPGSVKISPDGKLLLYSVSKSDIEKRTYSSSLFLMNTDGTGKKLVKENANSANWIEGGKKIIFLAPGEDGMQIYSYEVKSGSVEKITDMKDGVDSYVWSPLNNAILITKNVYRENNSFEYLEKKNAEKKNKKHTGMLYDELLFRPYSRWDNGTVSHIYYYDFATKQLKDITPGKFDAPASHLGGNEDITFSPDGKKIAYTSNTDPVKAISTNNDIFLVNTDGSNTERITEKKGNDNYPVFSPDGKYIVYAEMDSIGYESDQKDLIFYNINSKEKKNLTAVFDYSVDDIIWTSDSKNVYITCKEKGFDALYKINISKGDIKNIVKGHCFGNVSISNDEKYFYCTKSQPDRPAEIYSYNINKKEFKQLTSLTDSFVKNYNIPKTEVFWYKGAYGDSVMAFITYPVNYDASKKYPLVFLFHGGPEGDWDGSWSNYGGNVNVIASDGYFVIKPNIHGAASYGAKFKEAILKHWGKVDQEDVFKCIEYVKEKYPAVNTDKIGASGRSYGGFLVNWLNGQTDKFSCFVSVDGIFDHVMEYYSTDELWFPEMEFGGTPMTNREEFIRASPGTYAHNFKTPTLVAHGGRDYRVDLSQGIAMFTALKRKGIDTRFLYFPEEGHYFFNPQNWKYFYQLQSEWFEKYLKN